MMAQDTTQNGSAFVLAAQFEVKPGQAEGFLGTALEDVRHSVADEPGCRQLDVVCPQNSETSVLFYEVCSSRAAFDSHIETPHLAQRRHP